MADNRLLRFVERAFESGASEEDVRRVLASAGWSQEQIGDAVAHFARVDFPIAVPRPKAQLSARDAFMYLLLFATLYVSSYQFGNLLFQFVNLAFPDELNAYRTQFAGRSIRWAVASLIVAFPIFLLLARRLAAETHAEPVRRTSAIRKWLTYLTLFVAAGVLVGDSITLLFNLLSGELTMRFVLKACIVALIAGTIFGYYLQQMRADDAALSR